MARVFQLIFAVLAVAILTIPALPASAGEREVSYLHSLAGTYVGSGTMRLGRDRAKVTCNLALRPSGSKLNVSGFCIGSEISGTITYDDRSRKWVSTSGGRAVAGRRSGSSLTFTTSERTKNSNVRSTFTFAPRKASVKFELLLRGGHRGSGTVNFRRQ